MEELLKKVQGAGIEAKDMVITEELGSQFWHYYSGRAAALRDVEIMIRKLMLREEGDKE